MEAKDVQDGADDRLDGGRRKEVGGEVHLRVWGVPLGDYPGVGWTYWGEH